MAMFLTTTMQSLVTVPRKGVLEQAHSVLSVLESSPNVRSSPGITKLALEDMSVNQDWQLDELDCLKALLTKQ